MQQINICITTYFRPKLLRRCLDSLKKYLPYLKVWVVSDTTEDQDYQTILKEYKQYYNIKFFAQKNSGLSNARNFLIKKVQAGYILFIDDDDTLNHQFGQWCAQQSLKNELKAPIIKFRLKTIYDDRRSATTKYPLSWKKLSGFDKFASSHVSTFLVKKDFLDKHNLFFWPNVLSEDTFFWPLLLEASQGLIPLYKKVCTINHYDVKNHGPRITDNIEKIILTWKSVGHKAANAKSALLWARIFVSVNMVIRHDLNPEWSQAAQDILKKLWTNCQKRKWKIFKALPAADKIVVFWRIFSKLKFNQKIAN